MNCQRRSELRATYERLTRIVRVNGQRGIRVAIRKQPEANTVEVCEAIEERIAAREIMYGVNTGIGEFSEVILTPQQTHDFQRYLIYNHAAGIGEPCPEDWVRAAILLRVNVHAHGHSGCRPEITQTYAALLNAGITPVMCAKGSVGACGDLAPMSQIALTLMGEGECFYRGNRVASHRRSQQKGRHTTVPAHMPESHRQAGEWTPQRLSSWAAKTGPATEKLITTVLTSRRHPQQAYRSCLGILRLGKAYGDARLG